MNDPRRGARDRSILERKLLFVLKVGENHLELRKLGGINARKLDAKAIAINPSHSDFVNP